MKVTISGLAGSGTSTVAEMLSEELGVDLISAGDVFRREAERRGMSLEEFGALASEDPEIDRTIDERQSEVASRHDSLVLEGRLAGWMVDADLKVWLRAPLEVRAQRVAERESKSLDEAVNQIEERGRCESERYEEHYGIDIDELSIYHLVVDTSLWGPGGVSAVVEAGVGAL